MGAGVRSVLQVHQDKEREDAGNPFCRLLGKAKGNLGPRAATVYFRYEPVQLTEDISSYRVAWDLEEPDRPVEDVLRGNRAAAKGRGGSKAKVEEKLLEAFQRTPRQSARVVADILVGAGISSAAEKGPGQWRGWKEFCTAYNVVADRRGRETTYTMLTHAEFQNDEEEQ